VYLLVDGIDLAAHLLQIEGWRGGGRPSLGRGFRGSLLTPSHQIIRADNTPSIPRIWRRISSPTVPSVSMRVYAYSPRDLFSRSAMLIRAAARQVEIWPTMLGTLLLAMTIRVVLGARGITLSG